MPDKFYLHPIDMQKFYLDDKPIRYIVLGLSPMPDTIGPFSSKDEAEKWVEARRQAGLESGVEIVPYAYTGSF